MTLKDLKPEDFLFVAKSGSHAYGLNTPTSDVDIRGIYIAPKRVFYGLNVPDQLSDETNDTTYYELSRFIELLYKQNPNIIELLNVPEDCIIYKNPLYDRILEHRDKLITKQIRNTFGGYAIAQIGKSRGLNKKIFQPMDKVQLTPLDFCYVPLGNGGTANLRKYLKKNNIKPENCGLSILPHVKDGYSLYYDGTGKIGFRGVCFDDSNAVHLTSIPKGHPMLCNIFYNKDAYSIYCKDYKSYWEWVDKRNPDRYEKNMEVGKGYDTKNMMHCVRMLRMAEEMLTTGELNVRRPDREELLDIRNGLRDYDELIEYSNGKIKLLDELVDISPLPQVIDFELLNTLLIDIRTEHYG